MDKRIESLLERAYCQAEWLAGYLGGLCDTDEAVVAAIEEVRKVSEALAKIAADLDIHKAA